MGAFRLIAMTGALAAMTSCEALVLLGSDNGAIAANDAGRVVDAGTEPLSLSFLVQPSRARPNASIAPAVQVALLDGSGQLLTTDSETLITLTLANGSSEAELSGTLTQTVTNGIATFPDLGVSQPGLGYVLRASASGANGGLSAAFNVTPGTVLTGTGGPNPYGIGSGTALESDDGGVDAGCDADGGC
jgi:hypothetical protein